MLPYELGVTCFPFLLTRGATPLCIWNTLGRPQHLGQNQYFGTPLPIPGSAPTRLLHLPRGDFGNMPPGSVFTLQGAIQNPEASSETNASVMNAIVLAIE